MREGFTMEGNEKRTLIPMIEVCHNKNDNGLCIEIDLAGASKESVDLDVGKRGFCVKAEGSDFCYESCYTLAHEVKGEEASARFESGLLTVDIPFEDTIRGRKVDVT